MLTKRQAKFVLSALSKDMTRLHLTLPYVTEWQGRRWIFSTDGHRMHALGTVLTHEGRVMVTADGMVYPLADGAEGLAMEYPPVGKVFPAEPSFLPVSGERLAQAALAVPRSKRVEPKAAVRFDREDGKPLRTSVWLPDDDHAGGVFLNPTFVAEALLDEPKNVEVHVAGPSDPVQLRPKGTSPAWQALIMPMRVGR